MAVSIGGAVTQLFDLQNTGLEDQSQQAIAAASGVQAGASGAVSTAEAAGATARAGALDYTEAGVRLQQQGDYEEAASYTTAGDIAANSAVLAGVAGGIQEYQQARDTAQTVGAQRAQVSAAGLSNSGSALALARDSFKQGYLTQQMTRVQTLTRQGGYLEEEAAARTEATAARTAGDVAGTTIGAYEQERAAYLAQAAGENQTAQGYAAQQAAYNTVAANYGTLSSQATVTAANMSNYLSSYLRTADQTNPEVGIAEALLSGSSGSGWTVGSNGELSYNGTRVSGTATSSSEPSDPHANPYYTNGQLTGYAPTDGRPYFNGQRWVTPTTSPVQIGR